MTFLAIFVGPSLLGTLLGFLAARRPAPTWSSFTRILLGELLLLLLAAVLASSFHITVLLPVVFAATFFLLAFSITEYSRAQRYSDYPEE